MKMMTRMTGLTALKKLLKTEDNLEAIIATVLYLQLQYNKLRATIYLKWLCNYTNTKVKVMCDDEM